MEPSDLITVAKARAAAKDGSARALRKRLGLTLAEMAPLVGVSAAAMAMWERGERVPRGLPALRYGQLLASLAAAAVSLAGDLANLLTKRTQAVTAR